MRVFLATILTATVALADDLPKHWDAGETLKASDLNSDFSHIHRGMFGGKHNAITDTYVQQDAGIQLSKVKSPAYLSGVWARVSETCTGSARCNMDQVDGINDITNYGAGNYGVTLAYTPVSATGLVAIARPATSEVGKTLWCYVSGYNTTGPHVRVYCWEETGAGVGSAKDTPFSVIIWDMNWYNY